jgi:putative oxidoreductase
VKLSPDTALPRHRPRRNRRLPTAGAAAIPGSAIESGTGATAMQIELADGLLVVGRLLLGGLFVAGGVHHFFLVPVLTGMIEKRGVPFPKLVLLAGSLFQIVCGALLMLGLYVVPAALGLVVFTVAASVMLLNFWDMQGEHRETAKNTWKSNVAIVGGLLVAAAQAI